MSTSKSDDPIIYFTLIDFLLQLIFLAIFLTVALNVVEEGSQPDSSAPPHWVFDKKYLPLINESISPFIRADDAEKLRRLLDDINKRGLLEPLLTFLAATREPLATLEICSREPRLCTAILSRCKESPDSCKALSEMTSSKFAKLGSGAGKPICFDESGRGRIFTVIGFGTGNAPKFRLSEVTPYGARVLLEAGVAVGPGVTLNKGEFLSRFQSFARKDCVHVVRYMAESDSYQQSKIVSSLFLFGG
jgi:hypothetical protein